MPGTGVVVGLVEDSDEDFTAFKRVIGRDAPTTELMRWDRADTALAALGSAQAPVGGWPSILVVDLNLPGMDGAELVRRLRLNHATRALPIFILSGSTRQRDIDRCYVAGANAYLTKPANSSELSTLLQMLFQSLAIFRAPTPPAAGPFDPPPAPVAAPAAADLDTHRAEYERQLRADRDIERRARVRAEALERMSARLASLMTTAQVESAVVGELVGGHVAKRAAVYAPVPGSAALEGSFLPDPDGPGTVAVLPLLADSGTGLGSLRVETEEPVDIEARLFLESVANLAGRALQRTARIALLARSSRDEALGLPNARWWKSALTAELREARRINVPLTVVVVELDGLEQHGTDYGQVSADALLLGWVDAWRAEGTDLLSRFGGEDYAGIFPGRTHRHAAAIIAKVRENPEVPPFSTGIAQWDGRESGDELTIRAEAALEEGKRLKAVL